MPENPIIKRIEGAKAKFLNNFDQGVIDGWYSEAKRLLFLDNLKGHKGIKLILDTYTKDLADMNLLLLQVSSKEMSDKERDRMIDRRNMYQKFVDMFEDVEKDLETIKDQMDNLV